MNTQVLNDKKELKKYLQRFDHAEHNIIYERVLKENYSHDFKSELDKDFYSDDDKTKINDKYVGFDYKNVSDRFIEEYYSDLAKFIVIEPNLYVSFNIPDIKSTVYEVEFTIDYYTPIGDFYIDFSLKKIDHMSYNIIEHSLSVK